MYAGVVWENLEQKQKMLLGQPTNSSWLTGSPTAALDPSGSDTATVLWIFGGEDSVSQGVHRGTAVVLESTGSLLTVMRPISFRSS